MKTEDFEFHVYDLERSLNILGRFVVQYRQRYRFDTLGHGKEDSTEGNAFYVTPA
jgi:hypothetical protein